MAIDRSGGTYWTLKWSFIWWSANPWSFEGELMRYFDYKRNHNVSMITFGPIAAVFVKIPDSSKNEPD